MAKYGLKPPSERKQPEGTITPEDVAGGTDTGKTPDEFSRWTKETQESYPEGGTPADWVRSASGGTGSFATGGGGGGSQAEEEETPTGIESSQEAERQAAAEAARQRAEELERQAAAESRAQSKANLERAAFRARARAKALKEGVSIEVAGKRLTKEKIEELRRKAGTYGKGLSYGEEKKQIEEHLKAEQQKSQQPIYVSEGIYDEMIARADRGEEEFKELLEQRQVIVQDLPPPRLREWVTDTGSTFKTSGTVLAKDLFGDVGGKVKVGETVYEKGKEIVKKGYEKLPPSLRDVTKEVGLGISRDLTGDVGKKVKTGEFIFKESKDTLRDLYGKVEEPAKEIYQKVKEPVKDFASIVGVTAGKEFTKDVGKKVKTTEFIYEETKPVVEDIYVKTKEPIKKTAGLFGVTLAKDLTSDVGKKVEIGQVIYEKAEPTIEKATTKAGKILREPALSEEELESAQKRIFDSKGVVPAPTDIIKDIKKGMDYESEILEPRGKEILEKIEVGTDPEVLRKEYGVKTYPRLDKEGQVYYDYKLPKWMEGLRPGFETKKQKETFVSSFSRKFMQGFEETYTDISQRLLYKGPTVLDFDPKGGFDIPILSEYKPITTEAKAPKYIGKGVAIGAGVGVLSTVPGTAPVVFTGGTIEAATRGKKDFIEFVKEEPLEPLMAFGYGGVKAYKGVKYLREPITTRLPRKDPIFEGKDLTQPITRKGVSYEKRVFETKRTTPAEFAERTTRWRNLLGKEPLEKIKLRDERIDLAWTPAPIKTFKGMIVGDGYVVSGRFGKKPPGFLKVSKVKGEQRVMDIDEFKSLSKTQKRTLKGLVEKRLGRPVPMEQVPNLITEDFKMSTGLLETKDLFRIFPKKKQVKPIPGKPGKTRTLTEQVALTKEAPKTPMIEEFLIEPSKSGKILYKKLPEDYLGVYSKKDKIIIQRGLSPEIRRRTIQHEEGHRTLAMLNPSQRKLLTKDKELMKEATIHLKKKYGSKIPYKKSEYIDEYLADKYIGGTLKPKLRVEKMDETKTYDSLLGIKDVSKPLARATGKTPIIKGVSRVLPTKDLTPPKSYIVSKKLGAILKQETKQQPMQQIISPKIFPKTKPAKLPKTTPSKPSGLSSQDLAPLMVGGRGLGRSIYFGRGAGGFEETTMVDIPQKRVGLDLSPVKVGVGLRDRSVLDTRDRLKTETTGLELEKDLQMVGLKSVTSQKQRQKLEQKQRQKQKLQQKLRQKQSTKQVLGMGFRPGLPFIKSPRPKPPKKTPPLPPFLFTLKPTKKKKKKPTKKQRKEFVGIQEGFIARQLGLEPQFFTEPQVRKMADEPLRPAGLRPAPLRVR